MENKEIRRNGYQPQSKNNYDRELKHGYQPIVSTSPTPPNTGSSVQPPSKSK